MAEDLLDHWVGLITPIFPSNAWIVSRYAENDHFIQIDWKLGNNPKQGNKRSRKIQIIIKEDAIENYLDKNEKDRDVYNIFLKKFICEWYDRFDPDHGDSTIQSISIPIEKWLVSKDFLNALKNQNSQHNV
jgi:hypothetical protein